MVGAEMHLRRLILLIFFFPSPYIPQDLIFQVFTGSIAVIYFFEETPGSNFSGSPLAYPCSCSNFITLEFERPICLLFIYLCDLI